MACRALGFALGACSGCSIFHPCAPEITPCPALFCLAACLTAPDEFSLPSPSLSCQTSRRLCFSPLHLACDTGPFFCCDHVPSPTSLIGRPHGSVDASPFWECSLLFQIMHAPLNAGPTYLLAIFHDLDTPRLPICRDRIHNTQTGQHKRGAPQWLFPCLFTLHTGRRRDPRE